MMNDRSGRTLDLNISARTERPYVKLSPSMLVAAYPEVSALTLAVNVDGILLLGMEIESLAVYLDTTYDMIIE